MVFGDTSLPNKEFTIEYSRYVLSFMAAFEKSHVLFGLIVIAWPHSLSTMTDVPRKKEKTTNVHCLIVGNSQDERYLLKILKTRL